MALVVTVCVASASADLDLLSSNVTVMVQSPKVPVQLIVPVVLADAPRF